MINDSLYFVEDEVGIGCRTVDVEFYHLAEVLAVLRLWQIANHDGGILMTLGHLVEVDKQLTVATAEVDTLWEKHGCIAMCVECQDMAVHVAGIAVGGGFVDEPFKER